MRDLVSMRAGIALTVLALGLAGCQTAGTTDAVSVPTVSVEEDDTPEWRKIASPEDIGRVERIDRAWAEALADASKAGFKRQIEAEGDLLDPAAAKTRAAPPPGSYSCRVIRFGAEGGPRRRAFATFDTRFCFIGVEGDQLSFTKQTGEEQPTGYLWDTDDSRRLIFLGTLAKGNEQVLPYGEHPERDLIGILERYGNFRYRLVIPWPRNNGRLDVIELIPVAEQQ